MAEKQTFEIVLEKHADSEATGITIPFDVEKVFGAKRVPVKVKINEAEQRTTIFRMGGKYLVAIPKAFRDAAKIKAGDKVSVTIEKDTAERNVEVPPDLAHALEQNNLTGTFSKMSYTHRKEYVNTVNDAKKEETRTRRIENTIEKLISKRK